jgi:methionyl-tRNA formyltransferase
MKFKLDSGSIVAVEKVNISPNEKTSDLRQRLIKIGGELLVKTLNTPKWKRAEQDESKATFCKKIKKEDGLIDLNDYPIKNYNKFRAYATWPRTFFFQNDKRIIVTDAVLENREFKIKKVLPEGKKEISFENFLRSNISK